MSSPSNGSNNAMPNNAVTRLRRTNSLNSLPSQNSSSFVVPYQLFRPTRQSSPNRTTAPNQTTTFSANSTLQSSEDGSSFMYSVTTSFKSTTVTNNISDFGDSSYWMDSSNNSTNNNVPSNCSRITTNQTF